MKTRKSFLLYLVILLPTLELHAVPDINPTEDVASADRIIQYVMTFTYDNAGNITNIACSLQNNRSDEQEAEDERAQSLIDDYEVSINADNSWERVVINVVGSRENPTLNVYNLSGVRCFSEKMDGITMTVNLSSLRKGVYLFQFSTSEYTKTYKLVKRG